MEMHQTQALNNTSYSSFTVRSNVNVHVDSKNSAANLASATRNPIEQLISEREVWERTVLRTCNQQLYELLSKCYALYFEMVGKTAEAVAMRTALNSVIQAKSYRFTQGTHTLTKIVKCVFGVDRRRVSAYSLVLREALKQDLKSIDIPNFIERNGGVEEVRRSKSTTATTPKQKAEMGKQAIGNQELAVVSSDKIAEHIDIAKADNDMVAIVTQQADGRLVVRALVNSQTVLNAALAAVYSENKTVVQNDNKNTAAANDDKLREEAIKAAAIG